MVDIKRLATFVKIVDVGSLTRAADVLFVAQPALSQQMGALESEFGQQLLIRSKQGVRPTAAGWALYRHAQVLLKQYEETIAAVARSGEEVAGVVSVGLAPYSDAGQIALPLVMRVQQRHPGILLRITNNFGAVMSEELMNGRLDMALFFDPGPMKGIACQPLYSDSLVACRPGMDDRQSISWRELSRDPLLLPGPTHTVRRVVDQTFRELGLTPHLVAELESPKLMAQAVAAGVGTAVLPHAVSTPVAERGGVSIGTLEPVRKVHLALGTPAALAPSEAAVRVREILTEIVEEIFSESSHGERIDRG